MVRYWSIGDRKRGWNGMQTLKGLFLFSQLRFMLLRELLDKNTLEDDAESKEVQA